MTKTIVKDKDIVVPGETLVEGMDVLPGIGTYREGDNIYAGILGLVHIDGRTIKLIPLAGAYTPKKHDNIIAKVTNITMNGWIVRINSAYSAMLSLKEATSSFIAKGADLSKYYAIGDHMMCNIYNVTSQNLVDVTMKGPGLLKLRAGRVIEVSPRKVPRMIGKQGSMVGLIKSATGCQISVGQNGLIWIQGLPDMELIAQNAFKTIEENAHLSGLTDHISRFLEKATGKKVVAPAAKAARPPAARPPAARPPVRSRAPVFEAPK